MKDKGELDDSRFSSRLNAPIFKGAKKDSQKVVVDDRFKTMLTSDKFRSVVGKVDSYGRKTKGKNNKDAINELNEFYQIDNNEEPKKIKESKSEAIDRLEYLNQLARGEISGSSSESEEENDVDDDEESHESSAVSQESIDGGALQIDEEVEYGDATKRIAIQNCDWENVTSTDLT